MVNTRILSLAFTLGHNNRCPVLSTLHHVTNAQAKFEVAISNYLGDSFTRKHPPHAGPRSAVGNVPGHRCVSDCRSRGREFDPGPVPYFRED